MIYVEQPLTEIEVFRIDPALNHDILSVLLYAESRNGTMVISGQQNKKRVSPLRKASIFEAETSGKSIQSDHGLVARECLNCLITLLSLRGRI